MSQYLVFDIETAAGDRLDEYLDQKAYRPRANLKDPEKIEADLKAKREADQREAALYWWTGQVICICASNQFQPTAVFVGEDERNLLLRFGNFLEERRNFMLIGKNSAEFDVPFLIGRYMAHDLGVPSALGNTRSTLRDVDHIFSFSKTCSQVSTLADYAFGLGLDGKLLHGSDVQTVFREAQGGDKNALRKITDHCARDVLITQEMLRRYLKPFARSA